jgi:hypothetical protein
MAPAFISVSETAAAAAATAATAAAAATTWQLERADIDDWLAHKARAR